MSRFLGHGSTKLLSLPGQGEIPHLQNLIRVHMGSIKAENAWSRKFLSVISLLIKLYNIFKIWFKALSIALIFGHIVIEISGKILLTNYFSYGYEALVWKFPFQLPVFQLSDSDKNSILYNSY